MSRWRLSIAKILIGSMVCLSTVLLGSLGVVVWRHDRALRFGEFSRHARTTADQLATALSYPVWNYDEVYVQRIIDGLMTDVDVRVVLLSRPKQKDVVRVRGEDGNVARPAVAPQTRGLRAEVRDLDYAGRSVGRVELFLSSATVEAENRKTLAWFIGLILMSDLCLILGLNLLLWRLALQPLRAIEEYAVAVSSGQTVGVVTPGRRFLGELESLRSSIERMVDLLRRRLAAAEQSERKFHSIFDGTGEVIVVRKVTAGESMGEIVEVNDVACRTLGYTRDEFLQLKMSDVLPAESRGLPGTVDQELTRTGRAGYTARLLGKDSSRVPFEVNEQRILVDGQPFVISVGRDVSEREKAAEEREKLEDQLRQAQKMEAVGRLAGGVAHDFNNLLTAILGYCDLLSAGGAAPAKQKEFVRQIQAASNRAASLTQQLLAFSRRQILQPRLFRLSDAVEDIHTMIGRLLGEHIELAVRLPESTGYIHADPGQLNQVVMNLAINARDAMPEGGKLLIETINVECGATLASRHPGMTPGSYVMLAVTDNGCGMDAATQARLFEPFFTTKGVGKGTGLGLATVHGIVTQSGGHIQVYSEVGRGTTFRIYFPRVAGGETGEEPKAAESEAPPTGSETILVVEDSPDVRELTCSFLTELGYHVLKASRGEEAEALAGDNAISIHLLLTDVVMPGMSGRALAERLSPARPDMKTLFMSGYTENAIVHHGVLDEGLSFIQKPFRPAELAKKIRELLG